MKVLGQNFCLTQLLCLALYYCVARYLPSSQVQFVGGGKSAYSSIFVQTDI